MIHVINVELDVIDVQIQIYALNAIILSHINRILLVQQFLVLFAQMLLTELIHLNHAYNVEIIVIIAIIVVLMDALIATLMMDMQ